MEPSPRAAAAAALASAHKERKKRNRHKAQKLPPSEKNEEFAPGRTNYNPEEIVLLTKCWVDISKDLVFANNQRQIANWERITGRYNETKPAA